MAFLNPSQVVRQLAFSPGMTVADFGAGSGHYTFAISGEIGVEGKVYAIEIVPDLASRIAAHARDTGMKNVEVIAGDLEATNGSGLPDGAIDAVVVANLLFQLEERGKVLAEAFRVLKSGGQLILVDWTDSFGGLGPADDQVVPKDAAQKLAESRGFTYGRDINAGDHHWAMIMRKK